MADVGTCNAEYNGEEQMEMTGEKTIKAKQQEIVAAHTPFDQVDLIET